jgi:predicted outer membrane protein
VTRAFGSALVILAAVTSGSSVAAAQLWEAGVKGGVLHSQLSGSGEFTWRTGEPTGALLLRRSLTSRLNAQAEVGAFRRSGLSVQPTSTLTLTADYIHAPLLLQYRVPASWKVLPYLAAGPEVSYRLRCSLRFDGGGVVSDGPCDAPAGPQSHRIDVGGVAGIGLDVQVGGATMQLESRIGAGARSNVVPIDVESRALGWSMTAGVVAPLAHRPPRDPQRPRTPPIARALRVAGDDDIAAIVLAFATTDISYARLVRRRSARQDLQSYAQSMLTEHDRVVRAVDDLVRRLDLTVRDNATSVQMRDESSAARETMYFVEGARFDSSYVEAEVTVQREFLSAIDALLAQPKHSADVRSFLVGMRPAIEARLEAADRLRRSVLGTSSVALTPRETQSGPH